MDSTPSNDELGFDVMPDPSNIADGWTVEQHDDPHILLQARSPDLTNPSLSPPIPYFGAKLDTSILHPLLPYPSSPPCVALDSIKEREKKKWTIGLGKDSKDKEKQGRGTTVAGTQTSSILQGSSQPASISSVYILSPTTPYLSPDSAHATCTSSCFADGVLAAAQPGGAA
ncbi:uncharacterized protein EI90DRAFT_3132768 [Cantharellus anzutake]|uniref:uncharacterized protein n=1 Tax=Cantharellus anzutake TaxID=1750568 RepID=UPI001902F8A2|nr:uncharacterized protein EI90DRAFT_3132768 [Cantharellus anzutake]KAF8319183.1 hypothetical protein EI90DRAFT_3132768 [Cantharellus anzutake]